MKTIIGQIVLWLMVPLMMSGSPFDPPIEDYSFDTDSLTSFKRRLETGLNLGYASFYNQTKNAKTSQLLSYNSKLENGVNFGAYLGYNITKGLNVRVQYKYQTTKGSALYQMVALKNSNAVLSLFYVEDHYQFHQVGPMVFYRFNVLNNQLFIAPGFGASYISFRNDGVAEKSFTQKSKATLLDAYLGLDYFISDHIGFGFTYYASSQVDFKNSSIEVNEDLPVNFDGDNQFNFSDVSFRLMYLF